jgi:hypothetical protein
MLIGPAEDTNFVGENDVASGTAESSKAKVRKRFIEVTVFMLQIFQFQWH